MNAVPQPASDAPDIDLTHYIHVLSRRRWIILAALTTVVAGAAVYVTTARPLFQATTMVLIEKEKRAQTYNEGMMVETAADDYYQTQYRLIKSRAALKKVYDKLDLTGAEDFAGGPGTLMGAVTITPIRSSRLVNISAQSHDPVLAAKVANTVAEVFVDENIESKMFISKEIMRALFPEAAPTTTAAEATLRHESLPAVVNSALIQNLRGNYADLETKWGEMSRRYTPEHPELIRLKSQMESLKARIEGETRRVVEGMKAELSGRMLGNNIRIIDAAEVPSAPFKPQKARTLSVAALLGLLGGYLLALGVDALGHREAPGPGLPGLGAQGRADRRLGRHLPQAPLGPQILHRRGLKEHPHDDRLLGGRP
ncbi:MAG: capsular exopolysaccharide family protein [Elusimicrobia bacterium]|nr:MAG: capsular exopolysaccharide family protein [Elusimicrobiota bacterium]